MHSRLTDTAITRARALKLEQCAPFKTSRTVLPRIDDTKLVAKDGHLLIRFPADLLTASTKVPPVRLPPVIHRSESFSLETRERGIHRLEGNDVCDSRLDHAERMPRTVEDDRLVADCGSPPTAVRVFPNQSGGSGLGPAQHQLTEGVGHALVVTERPGIIGCVAACLMIRTGCAISLPKRVNRSALHVRSIAHMTTRGAEEESHKGAYETLEGEEVSTPSGLASGSKGTTEEIV